MRTVAFPLEVLGCGSGVINRSLGGGLCFLLAASRLAAWLLTDLLVVVFFYCTRRTMVLLSLYRLLLLLQRHSTELARLVNRRDISRLSCP